MSWRLLRSFIALVPVLWLAVTVAFFLLRLLPGDAVDAQLAQGGASQERIAQVRQQMGLDDPIPTQYRRYLTSMLRGDLGYSFVNAQPVAEVIAARLIPTLVLAVSAIVLALLLGVSMGIIASFENGLFASFANLLTILSISTPIYWTGTLAILAFAVQLDWLPASGSGGWPHLVLPVAVLGFHTMGEIARVVRVNLVETRSALFIRTAHSKGLRPRTILWRHMLRVVWIPVITVTALQAGFLFSGTVITEMLFVRPGIGTLLLDSTIDQDYPVVQGIVVLSALGYVVVNASADTLHGLLDPRL